eukprot:m.389297 g.389297  ORF g.389297 m.389297 type:complete len:54 (-) comp21049_c0_seq5:2100-2261(-)
MDITMVESWTLLTSGYITIVPTTQSWNSELDETPPTLLKLRSLRHTQPACCAE